MQYSKGLLPKIQFEGTKECMFCSLQEQILAFKFLWPIAEKY